MRISVLPITILVMAQRCRISQGTTIELQSSDPQSISDRTDITEHAVLLMQLGSSTPSDPHTQTVETSLTLVASKQARFYLDGKRLTATAGLTLIADGLLCVLRNALLNHEARSRA